MEKEIEALALQSKQTAEAIRARLTQDGALDRIRTRLRNEKTLDFLYQSIRLIEADHFVPPLKGRVVRKSGR